MEVTHGPPTSPREYTALPSRDGALSIMEDGPSASEGAGANACLLVPPERGMVRAFAEEQPLLHQEEGLLGFASSAGSGVPNPIDAAPTRTRTLTRPLLWTAVALLVAMAMVLAVFSVRPPLLFPPTAQGDADRDQSTTRPNALEPSIHPRTPPPVPYPPKHKTAPKAHAAVVTEAPTPTPTHSPTPAPTTPLTQPPTHAPSPSPIQAPSPAPTTAPTPAPTAAPTAASTVSPTTAVVTQAVPQAALDPSGSTLKLWAQFPSSMDDETAGVQALLYANQNPANCSSARYLLWANNNYGMGSDLHTMGWALGVAFAQKRVLIYNPGLPWVYTDEKGCPPFTWTPDCFFEPLTRCQGSLTGEEMAAAVQYQTWANPPNPQQLAALASDKVVTLPFDNDGVVEYYVPPPWGTQSPNHEDVWWWRSQSTRYLVRPNSGQIEWTANYFRDNLLRINADGSRDTSFNAATHAPPEEAICIHVRHGDKYLEMPLHPWEDYMAAAQELVTKQGATPNIFLTTDDGGVIEKVESGAVAREHGWNFNYYYAKYERHNEMGPASTAYSIGQSYFGRVSVANLVLGAHPSCRWFVQTTGSNWNRLINEIRQTDGVRKEAPWIDIQPGEWRRKRNMRGKAPRH